MAGIWTFLVSLSERAGTRDDRGATAVEYGLMVALIAGVIVLAVAALGGSVNGAFEFIDGEIPF
jgi:pilus assembly protein Flp/PilA